MSDYPLLIHIGYPKAGSSWLQHEVFKQEEIGFTAPWGIYNQIPGSGGSHEAAEQFIVANAFRFSAESAYKVFEPQLQEAMEKGLVPVLSWEALIGHQVRGQYWGKEEQIP